MTETPWQQTNSRGETLVGVWHAPVQTPRATIVMLHGWSGTRSGPHQMLTRAARQFCAQGFGVLRFDFAGRGDSEGDCDLATLHTMQSDARVAAKWAEAQTGAPTVLLGLCSGCEIAVAALQSETAGVVLWSAPIFAAPPSDANSAKKRGENLGKYIHKLLSPATWKKIVSGQVDTKNVSKALQGGGGAAHKNLESNEPGQLPPGFRLKCLENWVQVAPTKPVLWIYGGADPIFHSASNFYLKLQNAEGEVQNTEAQSTEAQSWRLEVIPEANHSFYGVAWEREVFLTTQNWLQEHF